MSIFRGLLRETRQLIQGPDHVKIIPFCSFANRMPWLVPLQAPYSEASRAGAAATPVNFLVGREIGRRYHFLVLHAPAT
jgi:hypothetical protein